MRTAVLVAAVLATIAVAVVVALALPRFAEPGAPRLETEPELLAMMSAAPDDFETVVAIPTFASTWRRFAPLIVPLIESREDERSLAAASWLIGNAPVAIWTADGAWGAVARPDAFRRFLMRAATPFVAVDVKVEGDRVTFGAGIPVGAQPVDPALARSLEGHLFVLHGEGGSYPPMERPALTALRFGDGVLRITSRGRADGEGRSAPLLLGAETLPSNALLAARFAEPPRAVLAMEKTAPIRFERFLREGAMVALYGVEEGGLIPRPLIAFSVPADEETYRDLVGAVDRAMAKGAVGLLLGPQPETTRAAAGTTITHREGLGLTLEYARRGEELLFAFDDASLEQLLRAREVPAGTGAASWAMRARPAELLPVLEDLGSSRGLRLLARGFTNAARDLARALRALPPTDELTAELTPEGEMLVLRAEARLAHE